jgi:D-aminopeptidase
MLRLQVLLVMAVTMFAQRARDIGVPFDGKPGPLNAITDIAGIEVGHSTIISDGPPSVARTGVTAVFPRGRKSKDLPFAAWETLNANGEMTGTVWLQESGFLEGPALITNTHSVGTVRDAIIAWSVKNKMLPQAFGLPLVAETFDGFLNDVNAFHVREKHVIEALEGARSGAVEEGSVGGGTGMICFGFKGGIGTSSRVIETAGATYIVGALVQTNFGRRGQLKVAGVPVGEELKDVPLPTPGKKTTAGYGRRSPDTEDGSIIVVIATDAPILPHQLKRLARRAGVGIARTGGTGANGSGDIFVAFSTANPGASAPAGIAKIAILANDHLSPLFEAAAQATEEAIVNALVAAKDMRGLDGNTVTALPKERLRSVLRKYNRLSGQ